MMSKINAVASGRKIVKLKKTNGSAQLLSICQPSQAAMRKVRRLSRTLALRAGRCNAPIIFPSSYRQLLPAQAQPGLNFCQPFHAPEQQIGNYHEDDAHPGQKDRKSTRLNS